MVIRNETPGTDYAQDAMTALALERGKAFRTHDGVEYVGPYKMLAVAEYSDNHVTLRMHICQVCGVPVTMLTEHSAAHRTSGIKAQASDKPRLYLAGPVYGKPDSNREAFHAAEVLWQGMQYEVVNPLYVPPDEHEGPCSRRTYDGGQSDGGPNHDASCYMRTDLYALMTCQAVYMLDGWENSRGARTEWAVATALGLTITYETPPATPWTLLALPQAAAEQVPRLLANDPPEVVDPRHVGQASERAGVDMTPEQREGAVDL